MGEFLMKEFPELAYPASGATLARKQEARRRKGARRYQRLTWRNQVILAVSDWWEAWFAVDLEGLNTLTCERYTEFARDGEFVVAGKTALLERARNSNGTARISEWAILKSRVKRLEDAAVCNYDFHLTGTLGHTSFNMEEPVTDVLVRSDSIWRLVAHHGNLPAALYQGRPVAIIH
jgi:hypothetical protein